MRHSGVFIAIFEQIPVGTHLAGGGWRSPQPYFKNRKKCLDFAKRGSLI